MSDSGTYRNVLQVSPTRIATLDETDLNELMAQLLRAQAYRCGSARDLVNAEIRAADDGCDGWSDRPATPDPWLGSTATCWQFKSGRSGEPRLLGAEVKKPIPLRTLRDGGRFVVVASGSNSGLKGIEDRQAQLIIAAREAGLPAEAAERMTVYGSEEIAKWCNQHPAIAARWAGRPPGLLTLSEWEESEEHRMPYQAPTDVQSNLTERRVDLAFGTGGVNHLHIQGRPGVGKTRFALELCRDAPWRDTVIYFPQSDDPRLPELIDSVAQDQDPELRLMIVADEVQLEHLLPFKESVERSNGRVRLVTVGGCTTPSPQRIPELPIEPLDAAMMRRVVHGWYPAMPPEHVDYVTRLADGYLRLARLIANVVNTDRDTSVPDVLHRAEIRQLLDRMLGEGDRRALHVVAVLTHIGWDGDRREEGEAVAAYMGLDWAEVRQTVNEYHRRMRIAPRGGRYRYISPEPLGIYLALEALDIYPDLPESLPAKLPTEAARDAFFDRLQAIASSAGAREYSREKLSFFFRIDDFIDPQNVRRWSAFSASDPETAARNICLALKAVDPRDRMRIKHAARREIVWRLVKIAWRSSTFHDAATALALLAEAENEPWGNNASSEFVARYQVVLGGTALPYLRRLLVIDELLESGKLELMRLCVRAMARVGRDYVTRSGSGPDSDQLPEMEWRPRSGAEHLECIRNAVVRLNTVVALGLADLQDELVRAAADLFPLLRYRDSRKEVARFFTSVRKSYPSAREPLRKTVARVMRRFKDDLPPDQRRELEELHAQFEDRALGARLEQHVGPRPWERERVPELTSLATELLAAPAVLAEYWPWLTSGDASAGWELGAALAKADSEGQLSGSMPAFAGGGTDLRVVCGYLAARREALGDEWYEQWVTSQFERDPQPVALIFEVIWRCGVTDPLAVMMASILRGRQVNPTIVGQVAYAEWRATSAGVLESVLRTLGNTGHAETAIGILQRRLEQVPTELERWKPVALELVTAVDLIRGGGMANHYWQQVAARLVADHFREITTAILDAHASRDKTSSWFIEHESGVADVLLSCVKRNPHVAWQVLHHYLWPPDKALLFGIGFPTTVMDLLPADDILEWISEVRGENASQRAATIARLTNVQHLAGETLAARVIGQYGDEPTVADAFFSRYVSGSWWGPASSHWSDLVNELNDVAGCTEFPKLRAWASATAHTISEMAEQEKQREEEQELIMR